MTSPVERIYGMGADDATEQRFSRIRVSDFSTLPPETALAFTELADAVTRDYVRYGFTPFRASSRATLTNDISIGQVVVYTNSTSG